MDTKNWRIYKQMLIELLQIGDLIPIKYYALENKNICYADVQEIHETYIMISFSIVKFNLTSLIKYQINKSDISYTKGTLYINRNLIN